MKNININKIGLICIRNKKLLAVHKRGLDQYITVGGKIEPKETDRACLNREVKEEIGCKVNDLIYFATFERILPTGTNLRQKCYFGKIYGRISPNNEIDDYLWIGSYWKKNEVKLGPMLEYQIIPKLIQEGLL